jgi:hypothetical protein
MKQFLVGFLSVFSIGLAIVFLIFWWVGRAIDKAARNPY